MRVDLFDYELPPERIAQRPLEDRAASKLLVLDRKTGRRTHAAFRDIGTFLPPKPLIVLNDTAVIPARILGKKETGGRAEIFLLERVGAPLDPLRDPGLGRWKALVTASKKIRPETRIALEAGHAIVREAVPGQEGTWLVDLEGVESLESVGAAPLPPYIDRAPDAADRTRYQTVFAARPGAVAAPTAGLHFTPEILDALRRGGATIAKVTLHVGAGTFLPIRVDDTAGHRMHWEHFDIPRETADAIAKARLEDRDVLAVGTTTLRALETAARDGGHVHAGPGTTNLFVQPGFRFQVADLLLTNFHQPRSTLLMLVAAFAGLDAMKAAYADALASGYRFLSYGDAMLVC